MFKHLFSFEYKDQKHFNINFLGIKFNLKIKSDNFKEENLILNQDNLNKNYNHNSKKNILIITDFLLTKGGMETRLNQYLSFLKSKNYEVYILSEQNLNPDLLSFNNFFLKYSASNIETCILELIKKYNIQLIEFNFGGSKYLKYININNIKRYVKIGCVIHNRGLCHFKLINSFDYRIIISSHMLKIKNYNKLKDINIIPNSIKYIEPVWKLQNQNKALIISRLDKEKLKTLYSAIEYCKRNNIDFDIAGYKSVPISNILKNKYNISDTAFIGEIDSILYLKENWDKYLFVCGVGQVIIEAGILGFPCFCCSHINFKESSFITIDNIVSDSWNFTINRKKFINKIQYLDTNNIHKYNLNTYFKEKRSLDKKLEEYFEIINI